MGGFRVVDECERFVKRALAAYRRSPPSESPVVLADHLIRGLDTGPWAGLLVWQDGLGCNPTAPVSLGGQTNLNIAGTIYAPKAPVTLSGGSSGTGVATVQIISWQWTITGGATLSMPYDPRELFHRAQKGLVH